MKNNTQTWLDLGDVGVMAQVRLNGKDLGVLWMKPFRLDVSKVLKPGENILEVDVTNLWCNRLIGDEQYPDDCQWGEKGQLTQWPEWLAAGKISFRERITDGLENAPVAFREMMEGANIGKQLVRVWDGQ